MRAKVLPFAVVGLVFFLTAGVWEWNYYSSKDFIRGIRSRSEVTYSTESDRSNDLSGNRKLGLPQKTNKRSSITERTARLGAAPEVKSGLQSDSTQQNTFQLSNPAIILFCYDR